MRPGTEFTTIFSLTARQLARLERRLWARVGFGDWGDCWSWRGATNQYGYGVIGIDGRRTMLVHRVSFELLAGSIPSPTPFLDHVHDWGCRLKTCVNVLHLEPVTGAINTRRWADLTTHCPQGHPYTGANLFVDRRGSRRCNTCRRERD